MSRREALFDRRTVIAGLASGSVGSIAGCLSDPSFPDADVLAGPEGRLVFEPEVATVTVGETVTWGFPSSGHNVSCRPEHSDVAELPDDAEPFASYEPGEPPRRSLVPRGGTYEHRFEEAGQYVYVCVPHVDRGMVGAIHVG